MTLSEWNTMVNGMLEKGVLVMSMLVNALRITIFFFTVSKLIYIHVNSLYIMHYFNVYSVHILNTFI